MHFCAWQDGRQKIEKRSYAWRFLALKVPFGNACFPNEVPWPGRLRTELNCSLRTLDAGQARELQQKRPASHTYALGELFIADEWAEVQEKVYEVDAGGSRALGVTVKLAETWGEKRIELRSTGRARAPVPTRLVPTPHLWELQGYEFRWVMAGVDDGLAKSEGEPGGLAGLEVSRRGDGSGVVRARIGGEET